MLDYAPGIIFVTAFDKYALKAFKLDAFEYLMKPVSSFELIKAVEKARSRLQLTGRITKPDMKPSVIERISVPTSDGFIFLKLGDVVRMVADGSYTKVIRLDGTQLIISKHIGAVERMTESANFQRVHKSHLINLDHLTQYVKGEGGEVYLADGSRVPISRDRKSDFLKAIGSLPNTGRL